MNKANFDPKYLAEIEPICRRIAKAIFAKEGIVVKDGTKYGVDQLLYRDDELYAFLELEYAEDRFVNGEYTSFVWHGISIPQRKEKFFKMERPCWWMNFSQNLNHYVILRGDFILKYGKLQFYKPSNNTKGEWFYIIPMVIKGVNINKIPKDLRDQAILFP